MPDTHIDALVSSLEHLAGINPKLTMESSLPVIDAVLAEHDVDRGGAIRVDELLVIAKAAQADA